MAPSDPEGILAGWPQFRSMPSASGRCAAPHLRPPVPDPPPRLSARPIDPRSPRAPRTLPWSLCVGLGAALALAGCKSAHAHAESADEEVYAILEARRLELEADLGSVDIDPSLDTLRLRLEAEG